MDIKKMLKSWQPTAISLITAFFGFVAWKPIYFPPWLVDVAGYIALGGLATLGFVTKQHNVTGGTVVQPSTEAAKAAVLNPTAQEPKTERDTK